MKWLLYALLLGAASAQAGEIDGCEAHSEAECTTSPNCTLHYIAKNRYQCRTAANQCENGFVQWIDFSKIKANPDDPGQVNYSQVESCEKKKGCEFIPGSGYCQHDVLCRTSGGNPPQCQLAR